jgi:hypothetical protein
MQRWPIGLATLIGLLVGAGAGALAGQVPVGAAAGLAAGVGVDSLVNYWLTKEPET